jgi:dUTP pyrophosphatase
MLKVQRLHPEAKIPTRAYEGDAGLDLYAVEDKVLPVYNGDERMLEFAHLPIETVVEVKTGIAISVPKGKYTRIECRSSLGRKGIRVHGGIIDSGYRNEITVWMQNLGNQDYIIKKGDKIAQLVIMSVELLEVKEVEELEESERGLKGHGSSGK